MPAPRLVMVRATVIPGYNEHLKNVFLYVISRVRSKKRNYIINST